MQEGKGNGCAPTETAWEWNGNESLIRDYISHVYISDQSDVRRKRCFISSAATFQRVGSFKSLIQIFFHWLSLVLVDSLTFL